MGAGLTRRPLTARALNRATLARQLLLERERLDASEALRRVVALQAQEPASPYVALWNRISGFDPADLDRAFADRAVVKTTLMRVTLHAVTATDYPTFHEAMQPTLRAARLHDGRFTRTGLSKEDADDVVVALLPFLDRPRTNAEVEAFLRERLGPLPEPGVWWARRQCGPFVQAPTGGPWAFGPRPSYVAAPDQARPGDEAASLQQLVLRYLEGFGPASIQDVAQFALVHRTRVREAIAALDGRIERHEGPDGGELFDVPGGLLPPDDVPAPPRLLAMWDSILLAYADRGRIIPPDFRRHLIRSNGDVLPALLVDGYVAGAWRAIEGRIEAAAFRPLADGEWQGVAAEAEGLRAFLAVRDPAPYRRYARWWAALPDVDLRVLAG